MNTKPIVPSAKKVAIAVETRIASCSLLVGSQWRVRCLCSSITATYDKTIIQTVKLSLIAHAKAASAVFRTLHHGHFGPLKWCTLHR